MWNAISLVQDLNSCRRVHFYDDNNYTHVSLLTVESFNSKLIKKGFRTWNKKSLRVFEFRDSYVFYVFYVMYICNERPMYILQIAVFTYSYINKDCNELKKKRIVTFKT